MKEDSRVASVRGRVGKGDRRGWLADAEGKVDAGWLRGWKKDEGHRRERSVDGRESTVERKVRVAGRGGERSDGNSPSTATREIILVISGSHGETIRDDMRKNEENLYKDATDLFSLSCQHQDAITRAITRASWHSITAR